MAIPSGNQSTGAQSMQRRRRFPSDLLQLAKAKALLQLISFRASTHAPKLSLLAALSGHCVPSFHY
jgi:hypothetical protein